MRALGSILAVRLPKALARGASDLLTRHPRHRAVENLGYLKASVASMRDSVDAFQTCCVVLDEAPRTGWEGAVQSGGGEEGGWGGAHSFITHVGWQECHL